MLSMIHMDHIYSENTLKLPFVVPTNPAYWGRWISRQVRIVATRQYNKKNPVSHVTCHMSHVTCHMSCVMCRVSHVACHLSPVTNANSHSHRSSPLLTTPLCKVDWFPKTPKKNKKLKKKNYKTTKKHVTLDMWHVTRDMWHMTCNRWHVTSDMWHVTCETWNMTYDT